jgi:hypothetical protein
MEMDMAPRALTIRRRLNSRKLVTPCHFGWLAIAALLTLHASTATAQLGPIYNPFAIAIGVDPVTGARVTVFRPMPNVSIVVGHGAIGLGDVPELFATASGTGFAPNGLTGSIPFGQIPHPSTSTDIIALFRCDSESCASTLSRALNRPVAYAEGGILQATGLSSSSDTYYIVRPNGARMQITQARWQQILGAGNVSANSGGGATLGGNGRGPLVVRGDPISASAGAGQSGLARLRTVAGGGARTAGYTAILVQPVVSQLQFAAVLDAAANHNSLPIGDFRLYNMYLRHIGYRMDPQAGSVWSSAQRSARGSSVTEQMLARQQGEASVWAAYVAHRFNGHTLNYIRDQQRVAPRPRPDDAFFRNRSELEFRLAEITWEIFNSSHYNRLPGDPATEQELRLLLWHGLWHGGVPGRPLLESLSHGSNAYTIQETFFDSIRRMTTPPRPPSSMSPALFLNSGSYGG